MVTIINIIGPLGVGKSSVASKLAELFDFNLYSLDELQWRYFGEQGYNPKIEREKIIEYGLHGILKYREPYRLYTIRKILENYRHSDCVIDFGGGFSVFENEIRLMVMKSLLRECTTILLLPFKNRKQSVKFLADRSHIDETAVLEVNDYLLKNKSNQYLADLVIFTEKKTIEEIVKEIRKLIFDEFNEAGINF